MLLAITAFGRNDKVTKGAWWMPWYQEAMKDVGACDKLKGVGKQTLILRFLNGETQQHMLLSISECIGYGGERGELKHLSNHRKRKQPRFPK